MMAKYFDELRQNYFGGKNNGSFKGMSCTGPQNMHFSFPWNRIFEADINFDLQCHTAGKQQ
jgi:hypothetical protein